MNRPARSKPAASRKKVAPATAHADEIPADWPGADLVNSGSSLYTGGMLATVLDTDKSALNKALKSMHHATGLSASVSNVTYAGVDGELSDNANYHVLDEIGVILINKPIENHATAQASVQKNDGITLEEEMWNVQFSPRNQRNPGTHPLPDGSNTELDVEVSVDYLLGMRDAIDLILQRKLNTTMNASVSSFVEDDPHNTWGLRAIGVPQCSFTGKGARVAILDTGFDTGHPDFSGRQIESFSFIPAGPDKSADSDNSGHGTHCIGIACGPVRPLTGPRYGIAHEAEVFNGKVLTKLPANEDAIGKDSWILNGINWAIKNKCHVISLALGTRGNPAGFSRPYENAARRALDNGCLLIAATGNHSQRSRGSVAPVGRPANCPSILSVAAVGNDEQVADFSNARTTNQIDHGTVDLAGPGVGILSCVPLPKRQSVFDGTSMAAPHVAGIAALIHEETKKTGTALRDELFRRAKRIGNEADVGLGLARATVASA